MVDSWVTITIQELLTKGEAELKTGPFGTQLHASDYVEQGTPAINARNLGFGELRTEKLDYLSDETVKRLSSHLLQPGDIVFGRKGTVERHAFIKPEYRNWFQGTDCLRLRFKSLVVNSRFASYYFATAGHKDWIINQSSHGATMTSLNQGIIGRIALRLPPPSLQAKIVSILSAYDDLIENNTRRIKILEAMARLLYQEWFVKFRFPGHEIGRMTNSRLGKMPEGWKLEKLGEIANINALSVERGSEPDEINYVDIASVSTGQIDNITPMTFADAPGRARRIVSHGDVIWSSVRPNRKSYSLIINPMPNLIVSTGFTVLTPQSVPYTYLYQAVTTDNFVGYLANHATGAAYPAVNAEDFKNATILMPSQKLLALFHNIAADMFHQKEILHRKNTNLRRTRDLLLPKLISGEVSVEKLDIHAD